MRLTLNVINPLEYEGWDKLLLSTSGYSFFHSEAWARVLYESYKYKLLYFTLFESDKLLASVPVMEINSFLTGRRGVSLPFSDYCEPIITKNIQFQDVIDSVLDYGKKAQWKIFEFRGGKSLHQGITSSTSFHRHLVDLTRNEQQIFDNFRSSSKRNVRKALREGVEIRIGNSMEAMKEFYRLNCMTRKRHGIPSEPWYFFKKIYKHIISKDKGIIVLAFHKKKVIASAIYFHFGEKVVYKYGASDKKYQHLRANNLMMWEAIKRYSRKGSKSFCFGITDLDNAGLRQFKTAMATTEQTVAHYNYDFQETAFTCKNSFITDWHKKILQKMPVRFLKLAGNYLYKHYG